MKVQVNSDIYAGGGSVTYAGLMWVIFYYLLFYFLCVYLQWSSDSMFILCSMYKRGIVQVSHRDVGSLLQLRFLLVVAEFIRLTVNIQNFQRTVLQQHDIATFASSQG